MLQIQNTLVSLDLIERFFVCNLDACLGECCIEGDAGAPLSAEEDDRLRALLPRLLPMMTPAARRAAKEDGPSYVDPDGDIVTQIVGGRDCIYTFYAHVGQCLCLLEKLRREGHDEFFKPISCSLYPVRVKSYDGFTAVNFHRWKICRAAETLGRANGVRAFEFLREPLTRRFGKQWYDELALTAHEYLRQNPTQKD